MKATDPHPMTLRKLLLALVLLFLAVPSASAQKTVIPPGDKEPFLRLEAGGPTTFVTALAFSPDGQTLYAAGYDKVVRVWKLNPRTGKFVLDQAAYRVPIGPGLDGAINAIALSPDGTWLAAGGMGIVRGGAGFRRPGLVLSTDIAMTPERWLDQGMIYVFNTKTGTVRSLRGHRGPVLALAFAPAAAGKPPLLVSAAQERDSKRKKFVGGVRLWDISRPAPTAYLDGRWGLPLDLDTRPALAVWHTGRRLKQMKAAIAWGEGKVRLWDIDEEQGIWAAEDGKYDNTAVYSPNLKQLLTCSFDGRSGRLQAWNVPSGPDLEADPNRRVTFTAREKDVNDFPRALTLASAREKGPLDMAVVVLRVPAKKEEYRLLLIDLLRRNFGDIKAQAVLWRGGRNLPVLAAAPGGRYLAVAGNSNHEIFLYSIPDLLNNRGQPQRLRSIATTIRHISFAAGAGRDFGLWLSERAKTLPGGLPAHVANDDLIFHFAKRTLLTNSKGWRIVGPAMNGWEAKSSIVRRNVRGLPTAWAVSVLHDGEEKRRIKLKALLVTDYALLPPQKPLHVPILVVAFLDEKVQPWLYLYNAETGEQIRQLTGHADRIGALAFSPDGRLLASAADDQTVCVWSLTNLTKFLGQRGMLLGVGVKAVPGGLEIVHLDRDATARKKLARGDVIEGLVEAGKLQRVQAPLDFYDSISLLKPGQDVVLRLRGKGNAAVKLGHAVDDWKPLLTLFITRQPKEAAREWVGWNPHGQYDASDRKTERLIGWHFNTGDPTRPTKFALADQYRKSYYRRGILKHLVAEGSLSGALKAWEEEDRHRQLPEPKMNVWCDPIGPDPAKVDGRGETLVQKPQERLVVAIDDFPLDRIDSVQWQLAGKPLQAFAQLTGREQSSPLPKLPWQRGDRYRFRVVVHTQEAEPQQYSKELILRYQPPPPDVTLKPAGAHVIVTKPTFRLQAEIRPGVPGQTFEVTLVHRYHGKVLVPPIQLPQGLKIDRDIKLLHGDNRINVVAVNKDALKGYEEFETWRRSLVITYRPTKTKKASPPEISLDKVVPGPGVEAGGLVIQPGKPVIVHTPTVQVDGTIQAAGEKLIKAQWSRDDAKTGKPLAGFVPGRMNQVRIHERLVLEPGLQLFRFVAKSTTSGEAESRLRLDYRPNLPKLELMAPVPGAVFDDPGKGPVTAKLQARLILPADLQPFAAEVLLNDKKVAHTIKGQILRATLPLQPLDNHVQVRLWNRWHMAAVAADLYVRLVRPPRIVKTQAPRLGAKALTDLTAEVMSPLPLSHDAIQATINHLEVPPDRIQVDKVGAGWRVQLKDVPLQPGPNEARLVVRNREAQCRQPGIWKFNFAPPRPPAPPQVEILDPAKNITITDPEVTVRFRVKSATPLKRVQLVRQGRELVRRSFDLEGEKVNAHGFFVLQTKLALLPRDNVIRVEAVNDGGAVRASVVVNYLRMPVRVVLDRLIPTGGKPIAPKVLADGRLLFPPMPDGRVSLEGRVIWDKVDDTLLKKVNWVRLYVNGFQQVPAELMPLASTTRERTFHRDILLNKAEENWVEITLPNIPQEASNRSEFKVACRKPARGQRLHLLIVGIGEKDEQALVDKALAALGAKLNARGGYTSEAFEQVRLYGPLTDYVSPNQVFAQLRLLKKTIDLFASQGSANDVVWVYYQGGEAIRPQGHFFLTSVSVHDKDLRHSAVTCDGLANFFAETLGAQLFSLDVDPVASREHLAPGEAPDKVVKSLIDPNLSVIRYRELKSPKNKPLLLTDLQELMPRVKQWGDVVKLVKAKTARIDPATLLVFQRTPEPLAGLIIGAKP